MSHSRHPSLKNDANATVFFLKHLSKSMVNKGKLKGSQKAKKKGGHFGPSKHDGQVGLGLAYGECAAW